MADGNGKPRYDGETVELGGQSYVVPSLSIKQARTLWPKILDLNKGITTETLPQKYGDGLAVIHAALTRNYPDLKIEELEEWIDLRNLQRLMLIVSGQSGVPAEGPRPDAGEGIGAR